MSNKSSSADPQADTRREESRMRNDLAKWIVIVAMSGVVILGTTIILTGGTQVSQSAQYVFSAVLPLFGTWVGTVLAYFFAKENFEAAGRMAKELSPQEALQGIPVNTIMTKNVTGFKKDDKVDPVIKELLDKKIKRLIVLKPDNTLEGLLYLDQVVGYMYNIPEADRTTKTLADLLDKALGLSETPAFVAETASLADAKREMERIDNGKVVIVTRTGRADEAVLGLLTNTDIAKYSTALS
jgi:CBS domain-containing protein